MLFLEVLELTLILGNIYLKPHQAWVQLALVSLCHLKSQCGNMLLRRRAANTICSVRYVSNLTSFQTAVLAKDYKAAEKALLQLQPTDLKVKNGPATLLESYKQYYDNYFGERSEDTLQKVIKSEKKLYEVGQVRYRGCVEFLKLALELNQPEKGLELWVSYLEALGGRTKKPLREIISKPDHLTLSLLAFACYFKVCANTKVPIDPAAAASIVPVDMIPVTIRHTQLSPENLKILSEGLQGLRAKRQDYGSEEYLNTIRAVPNEELKVLYSEARLQKDLPEQVWAEFIRKYGDILEIKQAYQVWNDMINAGIEPTVCSWNSLLRATSLLKIDPLSNFLALWEKMVKSGVKPDSQSYGIKIACLHRNKRFDEALQEFNKLRESNVELLDIFVVNNMLNALLGQNMFESALNLLKWAEDNNIYTNIVSWNTVLNAAVSGRNVDNVHKVLDKMAELQVKPDIATYGYILQSYFKKAIKERVSVDHEVNLILNDLKANNIKPNAQFLTILGDGYSKVTKNVESTRMIFETIRQANHRIESATFGTFIESEIRNGSIQRAYDIFNMMKSYSIAASASIYTQIIKGSLQRNEPKVALDVWKRLCAASAPRVAPTVWTYMAIFKHGADATKLKAPEFVQLLDETLRRLPKDEKLIDFQLANAVLRVHEVYPVSEELHDIAKAVMIKDFDPKIAAKSA